MMRSISLFLVLLFSGCATWGDTARDAVDMIHHGGVVLREHTMPIVNRICQKAVDKCLLRGDAQDCPELRECDSARSAIGEALKAAQSSAKMSVIALDRLDALGLTPKGGE